MKAKSIKSGSGKEAADQTVKNIRRATRKLYSAEEKIRIVIEGLSRETSIAELCRREGIAHSMYYKWSKEFLEAGKQRLADECCSRCDQILPSICPGGSISRAQGLFF